MRVRPLPLVLAVLLSGCGAPAPTASPTPTGGGTHYLDDPPDASIPAVYDLLSADFVELNGSVVLRLTFRDVSSPVPRITAVLSIEANETSYSYFVRSVGDPSRPAPSVRWEMGRYVAGKENVQGEICALHKSVEPAPFYHDLELLNNRTDLLRGGRVTRLHVDVRSFDDERILDSADAVRVQPLRGGPNPYDTCPLVAEHAR